MEYATIEKRLVAKANIAKIPIGGTFELTPLCNMNCDMCFVRLDKSEMEHAGRLLTVEEWLQIAEDMKEQGTLFLLLTGGEPLLYPDFKRLYQELTKMGFAIAINTNGTLINEEIAEMFRQNPPRRVNITLYGTSNETYSRLCHNPNGYDQTMGGIKLLQKYHIDVKLNGSLVKENYEELDDLFHIAERLNVPIHIDSYMYPATRERTRPYCFDSRISPKQLAEAQLKIACYEMGEEWFMNYIEDMIGCTGDNYVEVPGSNYLTCRAGKSSFYITWNGQMQSCIFLKETMVDVLKYGFSDCWQQIVKISREIACSPECSKCVNKNACNICPASAYWETGNYHGIPQYLCQCSEHAVKLINKYYDKGLHKEA